MHSFFSPAYSFRKSFSDTFNWLYENFPYDLNIATLTGYFHPSVPRLMGNPFIGQAGKIIDDPEGLIKLIDQLAELAKTNDKGRAYLSFGPRPTILLTRPEDIAQILIHNDNNVSRGELLDVFGKVFGEKNLLTIPSNEKWRIKRNKLKQAILEDEQLKKIAKPVQKIINEFLDQMLENNGQVNYLEKFMVRLTMDVFARTQLASKPITPAEAQNISRGMGNALDIASDPWNGVRLRLLSWLIGDNINKDLEEEREIFENILRDNFVYPNQNNLKEQGNLLQDEFKINIDDTEATQDLGLLLLAGHETTSRLIQFAIILLTKHPKVLEELRVEITKHAPVNQDEWSTEDLSQLSFLDKIIKETLRLYPPTPLIPRMVTKKIVLADLDINACTGSPETYKKAFDKRNVNNDIVLGEKTNIIIAPWITHKLESLYTNPKEFNPNRFKSAAINSTDDCSWIPFGAGDRNCPGRYFAMLEAKLFLIKFVQRYDFKTACEKGELLEILVRGTLKHKNEVQLTVSNRTPP